MYSHVATAGAAAALPSAVAASGVAPTQIVVAVTGAGVATGAVVALLRAGFAGRLPWFR